MAEYKFDGQSNLVWGETFKMGAKVPAIANRIFDTYANALAYANDVTPKGTAIPGLQLSVFNDGARNGIYRIASVATAAGANDAVLEMVGSGNGSVTADTYADAVELATSDNIGQLIYVMNATPSAITNDYQYTGDYAGVEYTGATTYTKEEFLASFGTAASARTDVSTVDTLAANFGVLVETGITKNVYAEYAKTGTTNIPEYTAGPYVAAGEKAITKLGTTSASGDLAGDVQVLKGQMATLNADSATTGSIENKIVNTVYISTDADNIIKKGVDNGLYAAIYFDCASDEDLESTI